MCFRASIVANMLGFWKTYSLSGISGPSLKMWGLHTFVLLNTKNYSDLYMKIQVILKPSA